PPDETGARRESAPPARRACERRPTRPARAARARLRRGGLLTELGRRQARQQAVFLLYQHDVTGLPLEELEENLRRGEEGRRLDPFARELVDGVAGDTAALDAAITEAAEGWTAERIAPLERNILRVAVHELRSRRDIPPAVSIAEAVALA